MQFIPYLNFKGQCRAAFEFYAKCFGGEILMMMSMGDSPMAAQMPAEQKAMIIHARLAVGGKLLMGSDAPAERYHTPQGLSVSFSTKTPADAERIFKALSENGTVTMAMQETFFSKRYGQVIDQFGIPWMINCDDAA